MNADESEDAIKEAPSPDTDTDSLEDEEDEYSPDASHLQLAHLPSTSLHDLETIDDIAPLQILDTVLSTLRSIAANDSNPDTGRAVERLVDDYERLKGIVVDSRTQTRSLAKRATVLTTELSATALKVQTILKASQTDRTVIAGLRKELRKTWKSVEGWKERESKTKEVISGLKNEVVSLRSMGGESGESAGFGKNKMLAMQLEQDEVIKRLGRAKVDLEAEQGRSNNENRGLKVEVEEGISKLEALTKERGYMEEEMVSLKEYLTSKKSEHDREVRIREKIESQLKQASESLERKESDGRTKTDEIKSLREALNKAETLLQSEQDRSEKMTNERDAMYTQHVRLQQDFDEQASVSETLANTTHEQARKLKTWDEEISRLRENYKVVGKAKVALLKKVKVVEEERVGTEMERDGLRSTNAHLMHDLDTTHKELEQATKNFDMVTRERDISQKNFVKSTNSSLRQYSTLKLSEQNKRNLEQEISGFKDEAQKMRKLIFTLEKDRDNRLNDITKLNQDGLVRDEDIKMKDVIIFDSKKKILDFEKKLKEQQSLYENVRTDRNVYSKNLLESQDEIMEMKRKLKIMNHQVEQLKEEISSRETVLVKEHFEHSKLEKEKESLLLQIAKLQQQFEESHQMIQNQEGEENKLRHIILEADQERIKLKKDYDSDMLGTHLIRRNEELSLLYEKIKIQTSTLNKGEIQYRERLEDIRVLRLEIKKLRREKGMLLTETQNVDNLRNEVFRLQRDILRERTRVKVLEEELESPMNIHRWRKLQGSDPSTYELISKIQMLQKRLIVKTEEVVEKELVIQQKEKLYVEVKKVLQRQPGPEIIEELQVVRAAVKTKALASELNMYHSQVNEYKYDIERLNKEMQALKSKYFHMRKRNDKKPESTVEIDPGFQQTITAMAIKTIKPNQVAGPRFSGGGFNMSTGNFKKALRGDIVEVQLGDTNVPVVEPVAPTAVEPVVERVVDPVLISAEAASALAAETPADVQRIASIVQMPDIDIVEMVV